VAEAACQVPYTFSGDEKCLVTAIGEQCSVAIRNVRMPETIKRRDDSVEDDFQQWFEHYQVYPSDQYRH
jgi:GAF domain-containing protein